MHALDRSWDLLKREFEAACLEHARAAREETTSSLNQSLRRLRHYQNEGEWVSLLLESAAPFAPELAVFQVRENFLELREQRGLLLTPPLSIPLASASALASAVESKDPVVALRTASQVGRDLAGRHLVTPGVATSSPVERVRIIPITNDDRVVAILFAAGQESADANGLELVAGIASVVLERKANSALHARIAGASPLTSLHTDLLPVGESSVPILHDGPYLPAWGDLTESDRTLHLRAQRFARVTVAETQLARPEVCAAGRKAKDLYLFLKAEIEKARDAYRRQFMSVPSMVDYLHLELVRVLAEGDETTMGVEYPGAMV